jgi:type IX secretion system PorP/SprF family membrane protein
MPMKKIFTLIISLISVQCYAQDYTFSQFYEQPILRNPALAGVFTGDIRISGINRNQWQSVTVPYKTTALSVEYKVPIGNSHDYVTFGLQGLMDKAGDLDLTRTAVFPVINFHKSLNPDRDDYLSISFMPGYISSKFDPSKMKSEDQYVNGGYSPSNPTAQTFDRTSYSYFDMSTGLSYSSSFGTDSRYYFGAALFHVNKPKRSYFNDNDIETFKSKLVLNAGLVTPVTETSRIIAFFDFYNQGKHQQIFGGALYHFDVAAAYDDDDNNKVSFGAGVFMRHGDAAVPVVRLDYKKLTFGLSYDANISTLHVGSQYRGGFEFTMSYRGFIKSNNSTVDAVRCARF